MEKSKQSITKAACERYRISRFLSEGAENGVFQSQLCAWTGLDGRTIRRLIERERRAGTPILSNNKTGYFLPSTPEEKLDFIRSMRGRAAEIMATADAVEDAGVGK